MMFLSLIPKKLLLKIGGLILIIIATYSVYKVVQKNGYLKAEIEIANSTSDALEDSLQDLNFRLSNAIIQAEKDKEMILELSQDVQKSDTHHEEELGDLLNEAMESSEDQDSSCDVLSTQYLKLFQAIYPPTE